ncbi:SGNH/GDSL hydrolase family protein, partial [Heyndrickxia coagulans]|uniref:SGNH/GDSL hydrolase family protein n=1 Tax=Heyndrickxia coagulans TaxID=1398 RepID=UPI003D1D3AD3
MFLKISLFKRILLLCFLSAMISVLGCSNTNNADKKAPLNKKVVISKGDVVDFIGSSVTLGEGASYPILSWVGRMNAYIFKTDSSVKINNYGVAGFRTTDILNEGIVDKVINDQANIVIFEDCLINDFASKIDYNISLQNIKTIISRLKKVPNIDIIILPPNKSTYMDNLGKFNKLTYNQYVIKIGNKIEDLEGVTYIDFWGDYDNELLNNNLGLLNKQ